MITDSLEALDGCYPQCCGYRMFIPDPESKRFRILDLDPHQRIVFLTQKVVSKLLEMFMGRKGSDPGSATLVILSERWDS
jgi:hypothetical protein